MEIPDVHFWKIWDKHLETCLLYTSFYSLAAKSNLPKIDYFGYGWKEEHNINMIVLDMGCLEEFGGWFTSLNIQYLGNDGHWYDAVSYTHLNLYRQANTNLLSRNIAQNWKVIFLTVIPIGLKKLHKLRDRKSTRLNSSHSAKSRMPSSA